jgi:hypothetical protein
VIFEKFDFTLLSFLKAILLLFGFSDNKNLFALSLSPLSFGEGLGVRSFSQVLHLTLIHVIRALIH